MKKLVIKRKEVGKVDEAIVIPEERLVNLIGTTIILRTTGEFKNRAYRLGDELDWEIGIDEEGAKCLVPLKKGEG